MYANDFITEANIVDKFKNDPKMVKRIAIAMRHDATIPPAKIARLGIRPNDEQILKTWAELLNQSLSNTDYGDMSAGNKFDEWLTRQFVNGQVDYEDIDGEGGDALGMWSALSVRGKLLPADQDFNRFPSLGYLQRAMRKSPYQAELSRIKDEATIAKHRRESKSVVVYEDDNYWAAVLLNYGACYTFNNAAGYRANFCTGSSSGLSWFGRYAPAGMLIAVVDKNNIDNADGKWQIHANTNQFVNADQNERWNPSGNAARFGKLFPGLMFKIGQGIKDKGDEIVEASADIAGGYNINAEIAELVSKFAPAFTREKSEKSAQDSQPNQN